MSPSNGRSDSGGGNGVNYIEHQVSKLDTLAGVAIKYGVEVADVKRINGLATDLQMFALKTLQIPLPGRHPPSPSLSDGENSTQETPPRLGQSSMLGSLQSLRLNTPQQKATSAMSSLQKYYGLKSPNLKGAAEGTEMAVYKTGSSDYFDDGLLPKASPIADSPSNLHQNSRNSIDGFLPQNGAVAEYGLLPELGDGEGEKSDEKSVRRRQKAEVDAGAGTPERLLKGENSGGSSGYSVSTGKGLAMRPKSASRTTLFTDSESGWLSSIPVGLGDSIIADGLAAVRKSSSASSLKDQETNSSTSAWPTSKWSLKPDLQALSTGSITRPIFDGLPNPISGRRNKAALD
ncbi:uncharacterized protein LOC132185670 isoform X2 [Corylus avellana]|uniref:uncharacterized protein LOC132185670 isoform X2 n=1 Tax=Corylus avellana TaxID=13451 RepID=UPI00286C32D8|nr:uncharacterized protein LOC132185670 isoform X2 [Corylus avellana]